MRLSRISLLYVFSFSLFLLAPHSTFSQDLTPYYDLYTVNMKTGAVQQVTSIGDAGEFNPSWSRDSRTIVHDVVREDSHDLYLTDVRSGVSAPLLGGDGGNDADFSPNGRWILFDRFPYGDQSLYMVKREGGTREFVHADAVDGSWAPDNRYYVFHQPSDGSIRTSKVNSSAATFVATGINPAWSPRGDWIAFSQDNHIWKIKVDSRGRPRGAPFQLTSDPSNDSQPSWESDGRLIVYHSNRGGDFDLWKVSASGGTPLRVTGVPDEGDYDPAPSPNGKYTAFASVGVGFSTVSRGVRGTRDSYGLRLEALLGPDHTDLSLYFSTTDAEELPLPTELDRVMVRVLSDDGRGMRVEHFKDVAVSGGVAHLELNDLLNRQLIKLEVSFTVEEPCEPDAVPGSKWMKHVRKRAPKHVVMKGVTTVLLRPDLRVSEVSVPSTVTEGVPFDLGATIAEVNGELGVRSVVTLYDGMSVLGSIPDVRVGPGQSVGVVFQNIRLTERGDHNLTVSISDASPAEYAIDNNDSTVTVEVIPGRPYAMNYDMSYLRIKDFVRTETFAGKKIPAGPDYSEEKRWEEDIDELSYTALTDLRGTLPVAPLSTFAWRVDVDGVTAFEGHLTNVTPVYSDPGGAFDQYQVPIDSDGVVVANIMIDRSLNLASISFSKYAEDVVYTYNTSTGTSERTESIEGTLGAESSVAVLVLLQDGDFACGGSADLTMNPFVSVSSGYTVPRTTYVPGVGVVQGTFTQSISMDSSYTSTSGITDSTVVPAASQEGQVRLADDVQLMQLPRTTALSQNYPNPFNPSTNLTFSVEEDGYASLVVYNTIGQEVATLFRGEAERGRTYAVQFNAGDLPTGLYYAKLETATKQLVRKMLLVK